MTRLCRRKHTQVWIAKKRSPATQWARLLNARWPRDREGRRLLAGSVMVSRNAAGFQTEERYIWGYCRQSAMRLDEQEVPRCPGTPHSACNEWGRRSRPYASWRRMTQSLRCASSQRVASCWSFATYRTSPSKSGGSSGSMGICLSRGGGNSPSRTHAAARTSWNSRRPQQRAPMPARESNR